MKLAIQLLFVFVFINIQFIYPQNTNVIHERNYNYVLKSKEGHWGDFEWKMCKASEIKTNSEDVSTSNVSTTGWLPAVVPGTVLNSLIYNGIYPEPYFGLNNKLTSGLIPDLYHAGRDFYTYWFRTSFDTPPNVYQGRKTWLQVDGINYRAEIWLNGSMVGNIAGMFYQDKIDISDYIKLNEKNILAIKVYPVDFPGTIMPKEGKNFGASDEFQNGGNGEIGKNVTMLATVGWDFAYLDGIRDRNTGIWKDVFVYTTG
ncbi:MAG: glycoside hydrolase family 2, partial [Dysgonamonadaceae bacterium]|nr:glycoside hydrolase family 2 [Dysgonamonadaceae bacterium]